MEIIKLDPDRPETAFARCREVIEAGGVIAYPTETFYGLGVDPRNANAVRKLFDIKGRQTDQPVLLLIRSREEAKEWASEVNSAASGLMDRFWPGPLTLVLKARREVLPGLTAGSGTIGLRMPGSELTRAFLTYLGTPLTGTSANRSGSPASRTASEVIREVGDGIDLILDAGLTPGGMPSTVVDATGNTPRVIREGAIRV